MGNLNVKGIDVRQTGTALILEAFVQDGAGALVTGTGGTFKLYEMQSDGTLKTYDFSSNTFKTTTATTLTLAASHRTANSGATNTGLHTAALSTLTGFTIGATYRAHFNHASGSPTDQMRSFQYGSAEGDLSVDPTNNINANIGAIRNSTGSAVGLQTWADDVSAGTVDEIINGIAALGSPMQDGEFVQLDGTQPAYAPAKAGDAMTLTGAALTAIAAAVDGAVSGTGANAVTVTVTDGAAAIQSAAVRLTQGVLTYTGASDVNGHATFSVDDGSYTLSITKGGYSFTPATIAVDASHTTFAKAMSVAPLLGSTAAAVVAAAVFPRPRCGDVILSVEAIAESVASLLARAIGPTGDYLLRADVASVRVDLYQLDGDGERTPVDAAGAEITDGSAFASPAVDAVVFDSLQTDVRWTLDSTGYNVAFKLAPPAIGTYDARISMTLTNGDSLVVAYQIDSQ